MSTFRLAVERALTGVGPFSRSAVESILEIAYLTMAVDEELRDEEIEAFSVIAAAMLQAYNMWMTARSRASARKACRALACASALRLAPAARFSLTATS